MSRRKQSKPQHVEFGDNKTAPLSIETLPNTSGVVKTLSLSDSVDGNDGAKLANGLNSKLEGSTNSFETDCKIPEETDESLARRVVDHSNVSERNSVDLPTTTQESEGHGRMAVNKLADCEENLGMRQGDSADAETHIHGQFGMSHRTMLHPKYNGSFVQQKQEIASHNKTSGEQQQDWHAVNGESRGEEQEAATEGTSLANGKLVGNSEEMYACGRCDTSFELIEDFVQHKKFDCASLSPTPDMTADRDPDGVADVTSDGQQLSNGNYLVSGNVIMTNPEISMDMNGEHEHEGELNIDENVENGRDSPMSRDESEENVHNQNGEISQNMKYDVDRAATPDSEAGSEVPSEKLDGPFLPNERSNDMIEKEVHGGNEKGSEIDETEKLRKEILATEAMANAIQNMTAFATQNAGENGEKPDISAIKYQVRMIQQQQAYQVQMLNFLQWQLALASSNPQAAMAAAAAASSRGGIIPHGFPGMQPSFMSTPGSLPGGAFMPQMMAAMAMNNLQNGGESNGMAELAKARLMMGMHQAAAENNNQSIAGMFGSSLSEQDEVRHNDHEQRYQLKVAPDEDADMNSEDSKQDIANNNKEICRTISDSGCDEDMRTSSAASGGMAADDTSSSHGSQEDGELRDNVLKSTAEEHRHRCRFCQKVFGSDSALQIHIRSHTGERPFKCNICGNRFTTKGNLKVHFTRHKSKYPHIPMNSQPVPEYLDHVPTSNGVPYGMSILAEKAVLERPRLHGNPSIHLNPQQASGLGQRDAGIPSLLIPKPDSGLFRGDRPDLHLGPADVASAIQAQLLQRRRAEILESQWADEAKKSIRSEDISEGADHKNSMSLLQAAMLPFLPGIAARQQLENVPPHLRYLLPHHLNALQGQNMGNGVGEANNTTPHMNIRLPTLPQSTSPTSGQKQEFPGKMPRSRPTAASSETTKLQRLVENIDRGRVLQKNECHMCHRILSCQSALKLHYRTHTGERPYKCDLCSRAFTTRGNLRTHYSSVHRQQMRPLPPGGNRSQAETFSCTLCPARFRDPVEFQHHMQMHAMVQAQQQQQRLLELEREKRNASPREASDPSQEQENVRRRSLLEDNDKQESTPSDQIKAECEEPSQEFSAECDRPSSARSSDDGQREVKTEQIQQDDDTPRVPGSPAQATSPPISNPLDSLAALSNIGSGSDMPQHTGTMLDHQLAALRRARASRLTVCEICEKPFSCQSALEIHLRTHTKERPFLCKICQRAFTTKGNLKQHLLTHNITDIPEQMLLPVSSPQNDNSASTSPSTSPTPNESQPSHGLKRPTDSVDSTEPTVKRAFPRHWCHICQKQFSSASSLQIHNRTHTGEKPFACNVCGRAFTTKGNLKVHMGTHVWGAGGSRRGRRISMDNPLISPWMKNMTRPRPTQPLMQMPTPGHVADPAALYQQYAALASGLLKQEAASRFMLPVSNSQNGNTATSPVSSGGSPHPPNEMTSPQNRVNGATLNNPNVSAATEWFLKAYQRTQEQVN